MTERDNPVHHHDEPMHHRKSRAGYATGGYHQCFVIKAKSKDLDNARDILNLIN